MDGDADEEGHFSSPTHAVGGGNHHQQHHHHGLSPLEMSNIAEVQEDNDDDDDDVNKSPGLESVTGFPDDDDENGIHQHSRRRTQPGGSGLPFLAEWLEEVEVDGGEKEEDTPQNSIVWLGFKLPLCCSKRRISWNRTCSTLVVV